MTIKWVCRTRFGRKGCEQPGDRRVPMGIMETTCDRCGEPLGLFDSACVEEMPPCEGCGELNPVHKFGCPKLQGPAA